MRKSVSRVLTLCGRNLKEILRDPLSLIFTVLMPLFMEILFYLIFHGLTEQFQMRYLAPGIAVFSQAFLTLFTGLLISVDRSTSFLTRMFVSKAKSHEFILAYALSVLPVAFFQSLLFFAVGAIFDSSIFNLRIIPAVLLCLLTSLFFIATGILLGCLCGEKSIGGVSSAIIAGQSVLSGMWFPLEGIGPGMIAFMNALPFRNATLLIQNTANGFEDFTGDFLIPLIIILAYTVAVFVFAIIAFKAKMKEK